MIQHCPDPSRLKAANIGVALFSPELRFPTINSAKSNGTRTVAGRAEEFAEEIRRRLA
jgi:hypothetical protein